jgi:hypothetical protein
MGRWMAICAPETDARPSAEFFDRPFRTEPSSAPFPGTSYRATFKYSSGTDFSAQRFTESHQPPITCHSPGNAGLSDGAARVSNDGAKSENADIAASAGNGKHRTLSYLHRPAGRYLMCFSPLTSHLSLLVPYSSRRSNLFLHI